MSAMPILGVAGNPEVVEALNPARHSAMRVCELLTPEWRQGDSVELPGLCEVRDVDVGMRPLTVHHLNHNIPPF